MHDRLKPLAGVMLFILFLAWFAGNGPQDYGPRGMSLMTFSMIRPGMSEQEVRRLTGQAGWRGEELRDERGGGYELRYGLNEMPGIAAVEYRGGIVYAKRFEDEGWIRRNTISKTAIAALREGMTMHEVDSALGIRGELLTGIRVADVRYSAVRYILSPPGEGWAVVKYRDGRVAEKILGTGSDISAETAYVSGETTTPLPDSTLLRNAPTSFGALPLFRRPE